MRTPANSTKQFMSDLVGTINVFFSRISKGHIQFQLSQHYTNPKKSDYPVKTKIIKKDSKIKTQDNTQKAKQFKKAFKRYREMVITSEHFISETKELNDKEKNKKIKKMWKGLSDDDRVRWSIVDRKKVQTKLGKGEVKNGVKLNKKVSSQ